MNVSSAIYLLGSGLTAFALGWAWRHLAVRHARVREQQLQARIDGLQGVVNLLQAKLTLFDDLCREMQNETLRLPERPVMLSLAELVSIIREFQLSKRVKGPTAFERVLKAEDEFPEHPPEGIVKLV